MPSLIFVHLSPEEEGFVASNHNIIGQNIKKVTHKDMVTDALIHWSLDINLSPLLLVSDNY
jgi:hypothetical protein